MLTVRARAVILREALACAIRPRQLERTLGKLDDAGDLDRTRRRSARLLMQLRSVRRL